MEEKEILIRSFVDTFILKERRERCIQELTNPKKRNKFVDKLNHKWDSVLDMKYLIQLDNENDNPSIIQQQLKFKDTDICYVISNYGEFDDKYFPFKDVFKELYSRGNGSIIINKTTDILFLETEQERGTAKRFIGERIVSLI